jgi:hypothetical protein
MADLVVNDLTVLNKLTSGNQIGGTLTLQGIGSRQPATEKALVVNTGAIFGGLVTIGSLAVGDLEVLGNVTATHFGPIVTDSITAENFVQCPRLSTSIFSRTYYVAISEVPIVGLGIPNGSATNPFTSIQNAIIAGTAAFPGANIQIVVAAGVYEEDVTISSYTTILASTRNPSDTIIIGNVLIDVVTHSSSPKVVTLEGLRVNGQISCSGSNAYDLVLNNCAIYPDLSACGLLIDASNVSAYLSGVQFVSTAVAIPCFINISASKSVSIVNCLFNATINSSTNGTMVEVTNLTDLISNSFVLKWDNLTAPFNGAALFVKIVNDGAASNVKNNSFIASLFLEPVSTANITGIQTDSNIILQTNTFGIPSLSLEGKNTGACVDNGPATGPAGGPVVYTAGNTKLADSDITSITGSREALGIVV